MTSILQRSLFAVALAAALGFIASFGAGTASAQCNPVTITNNTTCVLDINFISPGGTTILVTVPPGGPAVYPFPTAFSAVGFVTAFGNIFPFPPVGGPCSPCVFFASGSALCCASVCRTGPCTLVINPVTPCSTTCK